MTRLCSVLACFACLLLAGPAAGFNGDRVTEGPLTVSIERLPTITKLDVPQPVNVVLENAGDKPLEVRLEMKGLVDEFRAQGKAEREVTVAAKGKATVTFRIVAGQGACSAHYPVHIHAAFRQDGKPMTAHAVEVFQTEFSARSTLETGQVGDLPHGELPTAVVPRTGALLLATLKTQRVAWCYYDEPLVYEPVGWSGSDPRSSASFQSAQTARGEMRQALSMHPPYRPRGGSVFAEYRLRLPETRPISLAFFNAIRDTGPTEPPSDGVTFRVWAGDQRLFERHTDAKTWVPGEADLSQFAGQEILLRLESHPGPKRSTTCDSSFWGDPVVVAGTPPKLVSAGEKKVLLDRAVAALSAPPAKAENLFVFDLDSGCRAAVALGPNGLADGAIAFGSGRQAVAFEGLQVAVLDQRIGVRPSAVVTESLQANQDASGRLRVVQRLRAADEPFELVTEAWKDRDGLRLKVACPKRITDLALGRADRKAPRVYYGHGYVIVEPQAFRASAGGHNLATSHVGFDFEGGVSLLAACDTPPDTLQVDPEARIYALRTHHSSTLTFVPSLQGAIDAAVKYRPLYDKQPSAGVARKAGRFVFDVWGGSYAENTTAMRRVLDYGLSDALLVMHVWQRWGYDYRLPDIYPPDPKLGTLEQMQELSKLCADRDIPFALHDNYIDFYPDAQDFSYEHITFTESGQPKKAWINTGRDAQSYQWRPDHIRPFVERNLKLIAPALKPTSYFIDVFTSANSFDYFDRQGKFHSKLETRAAWGDAFAWIRDTLGGQAPMISEAGGDHLIGYVDGADCQFLQLSAEPRRYVNPLKCQDWDRVPWFDAVNHTRFSLHGVGYSNRYQGGASRALAGIESDDYLSAEILTGHALMMDRNGLVRGAVRKYWLAQDLMRSLAQDEIAGVVFGGDIHRLIVAWKSGARVYVNRSQRDWTIADHTLPPMGYYAQNGSWESCIERRLGGVVEWSRGPKGFYVNGRQGKITGVRLEKPDPAGATARESGPTTRPVDFGFATTQGAFRCQAEDGRLVVTPLPDGEAFPLTIRLDRILGKPAEVRSVEAINAQNNKTRDVDFRQSGVDLAFATRKDEFAYQILLK